MNHIQNKENCEICQKISKIPCSCDKMVKERDLKVMNSSRNLKVLKKALEVKHKIFLEGHTFSVTSVVVTNDNKYIISGSHDSTVRI